MFEDDTKLYRDIANQSDIEIIQNDRLLTDFVCLYNYEFGLSLCKIVRSSVILLLPLFTGLDYMMKTLIVL
jgi:hypothetical protein